MVCGGGSFSVVTAGETPGDDAPATLFATTEKVYRVPGLRPSSVAEFTVGPTVIDGPFGAAEIV